MAGESYGRNTTFSAGSMRAVQNFALPSKFYHNRFPGLILSCVVATITGLLTTNKYVGMNLLVVSTH